MATTNQRIRYDLEAAVSGEQDVAALARQLEGLSETLEGDLKVQAQASAQALRELGAKQGAIDNFVTLKQQAGDAAARLRESQAAAQQFGQALAATGAPTRAQAGQMEKLRDAVRTAKAELLEKTRALDNSRAILGAYGVSSANVAQAERATRQAIAETRAEVQKLPAAMAAAKAAAESRAQAEKAAADAAAAAGKQREAAEKAAAQAAIAAQRQAAIAARESARQQTAALKEVARQQAEQAKATRDQLSGVGDTLRNIQSIALTAVGGTFLTSMARDVGAVADQFNSLRARIALVTGDGPAFEAAFEGVRQIALDTGTALETTSDLFTRVAKAGKDVGLSQEQSLQLTKTINEAVQLSGSSAQASDAAITQLIQGLQAGVLRGEEFNSVMENSPRVVQALADGLGVTTAELRKMAQEGRLTAEVVLNAVLGQSAAVSAEFEKLPPTIGRALQNLNTNWATYIGQVDKATGASVAAAQAINAVGANLDEIAAFATRAGAVIAAALAVQAAGALRTYIAETVAARTATSLLALQMSQIPKTLQIAVAFTGFEVGYQIGKMLYENSELARKLGINTVAAITGYVESLRLVKEASAAIFSDDTIDAAIDRFNQRIEEQRKIFNQMLADAGEAPKPIEAAADRAANAIKGVGDAAEDSSRRVRISGADIVEAFEAAALAKVGDAQAAEANLRVQLQLAQQSERMALYLGNEYEARQARIQQYEIEIQIAEAKVAISRAEAEGSIAVAQAKLAEMQASKNVNLVKQTELENTIKLAQAKLSEADATSKSVDFMRRQLADFKNGTNSAREFGRTLDDLAGKQRRLAGETQGANSQIQRQGELMQRNAGAPDAERFSRPGEFSQQQGSEGDYDPGRNMYSRPGEDPRNGLGETQAEWQRRKDLTGQNAVDNTLAFKLRDKMRSGLLTADDLPEIKAVLAALDQNEAINRDIDRFNPGAFSLAGAADRNEWRAVAQQLRQVVTSLGGSGAPMVGRTVNVNLNVGGTTRTVRTDPNGAEAIVGALNDARLRAGR